MVSKYIPERNDVVWLDFEPTKGKEIGSTDRHWFFPVLTTTSSLDFYYAALLVPVFVVEQLRSLCKAWINLLWSPLALFKHCLGKTLKSKVHH